LASNFISPLIFLTAHSLEQELFQKVVEIMDYTDARRDDSSALFTEINDAYGDLLYKYADISSLTEDTLKARITEAGYESILDLFDYTKDQLVILVGYLPLIKMFRGTKTGLEIILQMFAAEYEIVECWENPAEMDDYTFDITLLRILNTAVTEDISARFIEFCRHYVYPVLREITISVEFKYSNIYAHCYAQYQYHVAVYCE
jgi:hypothetical protein